MRTLFTSAALMAAATVDARAMVGTNIGGWMVLESWITPSLFYRFLGKKQSDGIGMDCWTFCEALGAKHANKVLRAHWDEWLKPEHFQQLKDRKVELVRIPIGDWTLKPYGPYKGCMDGAAEKIEWAMDEFAKVGIKVLLDVHAVKDSQNGFDNSGRQWKLAWKDEDHFTHWEIQAGEWMGPYNGKGYDYIDFNNLLWAQDTVSGLVDKWGNHPALYAIEPVNEPWDKTDQWALKLFYRNVRHIMREKAPHLKFVFHDSFHNDPSDWDDLFADDDTHNVVIDNHWYIAWDQDSGTVETVCQKYKDHMKMLSKHKYETWVGEWSLATDACAFWLDNFNDSKTPRTDECQWVDCPKPYIAAPLGVDMDRDAYMQGPFGTNLLDVAQYGKCPIDSAKFSH